MSLLCSHVQKDEENPSALSSEVTSEVMKATLFISPSPKVHLLIQPNWGLG